MADSLPPDDAAVAQQSAGFFRRGVAYVLDVLLLVGAFAATQLLLMVPLREALGIGDDRFRSGLFTEAYVLLTISLPVWAWFVLWESGRFRGTPFKLLLGMRVVRVPDDARILRSDALRRTLVKLLPWETSHLIAAFPTPVYFAPADADFRWGFLVAEAMVLVWALMVALRKDRRGPHDLFAGTRVVRVSRLRR